MTLTIIKIIAFVIFAISCVTIYHNTNSYEPIKRIIYIIIGTIAMYGFTSLICSMNTKGINGVNQAALNDTLTVMKLIFTPVNSMIVLASFGNIWGKVKDQAIDLSQAGKRIIILLIVFIVLLVFEINYIGDFVRGLLG